MSTIQEARPASPERAVVTEADVLDRAADLLEEFDWCQGAARRGDALCMLGAVVMASGHELPANSPGIEFAYDTDSTYGRANRALSRYCPRLSRWNDEPGRTKAEVVAVLRLAAAGAREAQA